MLVNPIQNFNPILFKVWPTISSLTSFRIASGQNCLPTCQILSHGHIWYLIISQYGPLHPSICVSPYYHCISWWNIQKSQIYHVYHKSIMFIWYIMVEYHGISIYPPYFHKPNFTTSTVGLGFLGDLAATLRQILRKIGRSGFSQTMTGWWWLEPWNFMTFHIYRNNHPNWLNSYFSEGWLNHQPDDV